MLQQFSRRSLPVSLITLGIVIIAVLMMERPRLRPQWSFTIWPTFETPEFPIENAPQVSPVLAIDDGAHPITPDTEPLGPLPPLVSIDDELMPTDAPTSGRWTRASSHDEPRIFLVQQSAKTRTTTVIVPDSAQKEQPRKLSAPERRLVDRTTSLANRLTRESYSAFERGLMPLDDLADRMQAALSMRTAASQINRDESARIAALADYAKQISRAQRQIARFDQPGAQGWAADLAYAELLASNAQADLARAGNDVAKTRRWEIQSRTLAAQHFKLRLSDYRDLGHARLNQLSRAASYLSGSTGAPSGTGGANDDANLPLLQTYQRTLKDVLGRVDRLASAGAGLGRGDLVAQSRHDLARAEGLLASAQGNHEAANQAFVQSENFANTMLDQRLRFYAKGTASLSDLTSAWQQSKSVAQILSGSANADVADGMANRSRRNLARLLQLADGLTDDRGRNASDVTLVHGLDAIERLNDLAQRNAQAKDSTTSPAGKSPAPRGDRLPTPEAKRPLDDPSLGGPRPQRQVNQPHRPTLLNRRRM